MRTDREPRQAEAIQLYLDYLAADAAGQKELARARLLRSARLGEPMAKHALAYDLEGQSAAGTRKALRLYREAAAEGFADSAANLARHYECKGRRHAYLKWLRRAAEMGDREAAKEIDNPGPYLLRAGVRKLAAGLVEEGWAMIDRVASWGNTDARKLVDERRRTAPGPERKLP